MVGMSNHSGQASARTLRQAQGDTTLLLALTILSATSPYQQYS